MGGTGAAEAGALGLALKFGVFKLIGGGAALFGAFLMACVFEPKSKREMLLRAVVALGTSLLGTSWLMRLAASHLGINLDALSLDDRIDYTLAMGGMLGAASWFLLGASGEFLKRFRKDPVDTIERLRGGGGGAAVSPGDPEGPPTRDS